MSAERIAAGTLIDAENPWPGLGSFDEGAQHFFSGRDAESAELLRLVGQAPLTVLFGKSGLGKTSLLEAGLFPRLRQQNILPVYIRLNMRDRSAPLIRQALVALQAEVGKHGVDTAAPEEGESLWEHLHGRHVEWWSAKNQPLIPLFVFDQFEETFTLGAENADAIERLRLDLADLIENRIPADLAQRIEGGASAEHLDLRGQRYKVLLSFREDFLPEVEGWKGELPSLMRNRLRLLPMSADRALQVVSGNRPGGRAHELVRDDTAREIVRFVAAVQTKVEKAGPGTRRGQTADPPWENLELEPALLSLVCAGLNEKRKARARATIDAALLSETGNAIIADFYQRCVADVPDKTRRFIEDALITEGGFRNSYPLHDALDQGQLTEPLLRRLVDRRLLRIDHQLGAERVELIHDRLTTVVREQRDRERARIRARRQRRMAWVAGGVVLALLAISAQFLYLWRTSASLQSEAEAQRSEAVRGRERAEAERERAEDALRQLEVSVAETKRARDIAQQQRDAATQARAQAVGALAEAKTQRDEAKIQRDAAQAQRQLAEQQQKEAEAQRQLAEEQRKEAETQRQLADEQRKEAEEAKRLVLARQLAAQADLLQRDTPNRRDLIVLVAAESLKRQPLFDNDRLVREAFLLWRPQVGEYPTSAPVQAVAWSPDGTRIAAAVGGGTVLVWSRPGNRARLDLRHPGEARRLAWSPDGRRLAVADDDDSAHVWDVESGRDLGRLKHGGKVVAVAWGAGVIVTGGRDRIARLWDADSLREVHRLTHPNPVLAVAVTADGRQVATSDESKVVHLWNAESGLELKPLPNYGRVDVLAWSPDGQRLACGYTESSAIRIWELPSFNQRPDMPLVHQKPVTALAWTRDGKYLASGSNDRIARVWDAEDGRELARLPHDDNLTGVSWEPDGRLLATGGLDQGVRVWDTGAGEGRRLTLDGTLQTMAASTTGRLVASASGTGGEYAVRLWDGESGREIFHVTQRDRVQAVALSRDTRLLAAGTRDGQVLVMETDTGQERFRLAHGGPVLAIAWSPDGQRLVTAGYESKPIVVWNLATRQAVARMRHDPRVADVAWSPDGRWIASAGEDHTVRVWDAATGREGMRGTHDGPVIGLEWSPDSRRLATGSGDRTARIWDSTTAAELGRFPHRGRVVPLTWSADGTLLVTESSGVAHVWRAASGEEVSRLALTGGARAAVLSPDTATLTTISLVGQTLLVVHHPLGQQALLAATCARLSRNLTAQEWKEYVGDEPYRKTCPNLP